MLVSLMNEEAYVPMKLKELAILLNVPKEQREELKQVLNLLLAEGKMGDLQKGQVRKGRGFRPGGSIFRQCQRLWLCGY